MCGIAGIFLPGLDADRLTACGRAMADAIRHRGPDGEGLWLDTDAGLALAHRRLAILDLSQSGAQPMRSACGRYVIVFNGEIYNHLELRARIEREHSEVLGTAGWRGHSDTETLLAGIAAWGMRKTVDSCVGMFAIALWDRHLRELLLVRDRFGEKPLYYGRVGQGLAFASELKALQVLPQSALEVDRRALGAMMRYGYVPEPWCIYRGIRKLPPGTWLRLDLSAGIPEQLDDPTTYWSATNVAEQGTRSLFRFARDAEAIDALDSLIREAVGLQMVADVPLGAFLSGGVDSSVIVSAMQAQSRRPVRTFTIGFEEASYDESNDAREVARHLGTDHSELRVAPADALEVIPQLPRIYDEPFADSSQIPTFLVARMARQHVTVSLSGDGGDELFGGYRRHFLAARAWRWLRHVPPAARRSIAKTLMAPAPHAWDRVFSLVPTQIRRSLSGDRVHKAARLLSERDGASLYRGLVSHWDPATLVLEEHEYPTRLDDAWPKLGGLPQQMMLLDSVGYLPGDILAKVDRAAMAVSLETRVPLLDHRIYEFAWRLPLNYRVRGGQGKWLLRQVLQRYVPRGLFDRPKSGFAIPLDLWLRGALRDWAEGLLSEALLRTQGFLDPAPIRRLWDEHQSGLRNHQHALWDVLMFQAWLNKY